MGFQGVAAGAREGHGLADRQAAVAPDIVEELGGEFREFRQEEPFPFSFRKQALRLALCPPYNCPALSG